MTMFLLKKLFLRAWKLLLSKSPALIKTLALDEHRPVLFVSDVHLHENAPHLTALFFRFLDEKVASAQALFILGDLFNVWLGDDIATSFDNEVASHLKMLAQKANIPIYFLPGNRDFLLSKNFGTQAGLTLLNDPSLFNLWGKNILLTHGDLLCTDDKNYQWFRALLQHPITKFIFRRLPKRYRKDIAQKLRRNSKRHQARQPIAVLDATEYGVKKILKNTKAQAIIHGHVHKANHITHHFNEQTIERYVLGTWDKTGSYIELYKDKVSINVFE